ncbi:MAG: DUF1854 domain-containing protein [Burkholderiales bacterium]|nr:DUF1854 domain-containing protein [Burkholderiales bacterium]
MSAPTFQLHWNTAGRLVFTAADGTVHTGVVPVRAFPVSAAEEGLSIVDIDGHELAWIDRLVDIPTDLQAIVRKGLQEREFMPEIQRLNSVTSYATPSTWQVDTDRGPFEFVLKGEEDIRRLSGGAMLVVDSHGVQFLIRDLFAMDRHSKKLMDRFL